MRTLTTLSLAAALALFVACGADQPTEQTSTRTAQKPAPKSETTSRETPVKIADRQVVLAIEGMV